MLYNLRNGSTINLSLDRYLDMSDEDLERLELYYRGAEINDPFFGSVIEGKIQEEDVELEIPPEDIVVEEEEEPEDE